MKSLFFYYVLMNLAFTLFLFGNCDGQIGVILISHFNKCGDTQLLKASYIFITMIVSFWFVSGLRKLLFKTKTFPIENLNILKSNRILYVWMIIGFLSFVVVLKNIDFMKVRGISFTLAGYLIPLFLYINYSKCILIGKKFNNYFFTTIVASILMFSKLFLIYYICVKINDIYLRKGKIKALFLLLFLLITIIALYWGIQNFRGTLLFGDDLQKLIIITLILKIITRILIVDQVIFVINLSNDKAYSISELHLRSLEFLSNFGYQKNFGFGMSLPGQIYGAYGYVGIFFITITLYLFMLYLAKSFKLPEKMIFLFPFGFQIINAGLNLQTYILLGSLITLSFFQNTKVKK